MALLPSIAQPVAMEAARRLSSAAAAQGAALLHPANIWCVGRNFALHAAELGNAVPSSPMIFLKAGSCLTLSNTVRLPAFSSSIHYEVELAVQLGKDLQPASAAVSLDLTARDLQDKAKKAGHPWTLAKSFPESCPVGSFFSLQGVELASLELKLIINGETRQQASTSEMIFDVPTLVQYVRDRFPVCAGDLLLCGTPKGVGQLNAGDRVSASVSQGGTVLSSGSWQIAS